MNNLIENFAFDGHYRVQSRREWESASLAGQWMPDCPGLLNSAKVNEVLRVHRQWMGGAELTLRAALVSRREGKFAQEPDVLYKRDLFIPAPGSPSMEVDFVDVLKAAAGWQDRAHYAQELFADGVYHRLVERLPDLEIVIVNEYHVHEAGHFVGYDVLSKYQDGYFAIGDQVCWPLIYLEELRADLHGFGFALQLLPPVEAAKIFLYHVAVRFGVQHASLVDHQVAAYGMVPFLLFCVLREFGWAEVVPNAADRYVLNLATFKTSEIIEVMRRCAQHAEEELSAPEIALSEMLDRALAAGRYIRRRLDDAPAIEKYGLLMDANKEREY
jgi:hypothetical protein